MTPKSKLPKQLSPRAKLRVMDSKARGPVRCQVSIASSVDPARMRAQLDELSATVHSWVDETHLIHLTLDGDRLVELAKTKGVAYVEVGSKFSI